MPHPELALHIDPDTGAWTANQSPVILIPRHFLLNTYHAFEQALGKTAYEQVMREVGAAAARSWCQQQAQLYGLHGIQVLEHYLSRISLRGWGQFSLLSHDLQAGTAQVRLDHSAFVLAASSPTDTPQCGLFTSWIATGLELACEMNGTPRKLTAAETQCAADGRCAHCLIQVAAQPAG